MFLLLSQPERDNKLLSPKRKTKALDLTVRAHPETEGFGAFTINWDASLLVLLFSFTNTRAL